MFTRALASSSRHIARAYSTPSASSGSSTSTTVEPEIPVHGVEAEAEPRLRLKYFVDRTENGTLPVYSDYRNGKTSITTIVKKIRGDANILRAELEQVLADGHIDPIRPPPKVFVRPTSKQVVIKGHAVEQIKEWLEMRGF